MQNAYEKGVGKIKIKLFQGLFKFVFFVEQPGKIKLV
jgi:hypothetical protein